MFETIEKDIKMILKTLLIRLGVISLSLFLIWFTNPSIFGAFIILLLPVMFLEIWFDNRFIIKKQLLIIFWVGLFYITSILAGYYGLIGLVVFNILYFAFRLYKVRKDKNLAFGLNLIKNSKKLGEDWFNENRRR